MIPAAIKLLGLLAARPKTMKILFEFDACAIKQYYITSLTLTALMLITILPTQKLIHMNYIHLMKANQNESYSQQYHCINFFRHDFHTGLGECLKSQ